MNRMTNVINVAYRIVAIMLLAALLSGCGLKDDLYLPEKDQATEPTTETAPAPSADTDGTLNNYGHC